MEALDNDPVFYSKYKAQIRYCADRTGITATIVMPLVFLYAGRNNFAMVNWLAISNLCCLHRHTARVMFYLVVIHAYYLQLP